MLVKIWEKLFYKEILKTFFLFIVCFYGLYVLMDYSSHTSIYPDFRFAWKPIFQYYAYTFILRMEILIPFALLIASIKTFCQLNVRNELIAMMGSGIALKRLLRPFLFVGFLFTLLMYANEESFLPAALKKINHIEDSFFKKHGNKVKTKQLKNHHFDLDDDTTLLYYSYDSAKELFHDVYWIKSLNEIYHMKTLSPQKQSSKGYFVDHFIRDKKGDLIPLESFSEKQFPEIHLKKNSLGKKLSPYMEYSFSELWKQKQQQVNSMEHQAEIQTALYKKIFMPLLCLLVIIAPAPYCLKFTRHLPMFLIYICGIFGLVAFYLIVNATAILAGNLLIPPLIALIAPFSVFFGFFGWKFVRMK